MRYKAIDEVWEEILNKDLTDEQIDLLQEARELMVKKNSDYSNQSENNPFDNFELSCHLVNTASGGFPKINISPIEGMLYMIGIKLARLENLTHLNSPNFESVRDSKVDAINYAVLAASYGRRPFKTPKAQWDFGKNHYGIFEDLVTFGMRPDVNHLMPVIQSISQI